MAFVMVLSYSRHLFLRFYLAAGAFGLGADVGVGRRNGVGRVDRLGKVPALLE